MTSTLIELPSTVHALWRSGLCVLPAVRRGEEKRATLRTWKPYQSRLPTEGELVSWFRGEAPTGNSICLVCGAVSGHLEMIDFDLAGEAFGPWRAAVHASIPGVLERLVIESTPSGGKHVVYRCEVPVSGSTKLAQRRIDVDGPEQVVICGKRHVPRQDASGVWHVIVTLIETRGEGGLFLCAPSDGYELVQGDLCTPPVITADERDLLLGRAWALDELPRCVVGGTSGNQPEVKRQASGSGGALRPGDDFNARGDPRKCLIKHGWTRQSTGGNEHWCRPGKSGGTSATLKDGVFYVFSTNAPPFEAQQGYSPFAVYALLEHHGDFNAAASALAAQGYGGGGTAGDVDLSNLCATGAPMPASAANLPSDPGLLPEELLRVPGFVSEVMDHCLEVAPYPNQSLAFCGALALQAFLAGRKVRDPGDNRTNLYLLGLAHSSAGKDWPRKLNARVLHEIGLSAHLGDRLASGEGVQDAMFATPSMLFQTDEIDGMLQSINRARDARHESIMGTLLTMYSSSNSIFPMRRKAGQPEPGVIDQPSLVLFGTAIPNHYYAALSERMLTNGLFARMLIIEAGPRGAGQEPSVADLPERVLATARWWADLRCGGGNLADAHPKPRVVEQTEEARSLLIELRREAEEAYTEAERRSDAVATTVWGRASEQTRKLALLHAISENHADPRIGVEAVRWASRLVLHQTRRMLFMAADHAAETPFDELALRAIRKLREAPGQTLPHSVLLKRMKLDARSFLDLMETLVERGDVALESVATAGRAAQRYRLVVKEGEEGVKEVRPE